MFCFFPEASLRVCGVVRSWLAAGSGLGVGTTEEVCSNLVINKQLCAQMKMPAGVQIGQLKGTAGINFCLESLLIYQPLTRVHVNLAGGFRLHPPPSAAP